LDFYFLSMIPSKYIDNYIAAFPADTQLLLDQLREIISKAAPEAKEKLSYQMPAFELNGILVYFAGYKNHIGFYPTSKGIEPFKAELSAYKWSKGTVQFALDQPIPAELVTKIVKFRVAQNQAKTKKCAISKS